jgi:hypothetical protein
MRLSLPGLVLAVMLLGARTAPAASILASGNSMDSINPLLTGQLNSLGYAFTFVTVGNFASASTAGYSAIWLDGFSNYGNDGTLSAKLTSFMNGGGTVLVQNPGFGTEAIESYPFGAQLSAIYTIPPGENLVRIVNAGHPINAGLTGAGLS